MSQKVNDKAKIIIGLKKACTSLDKIISTLESEDGAQEKCFDVIQQNLSVIGLLKSANTAMLQSHLEQYIAQLSKKNISKKELDQMKEEIVKVVQVAQNK